MVIKQFLYSLIDGIYILLRRKGNHRLPGCRSTSAKQWSVCCLPAATASNIFIHPFQITVYRAYVAFISPSVHGKSWCRKYNKVHNSMKSPGYRTEISKRTFLSSLFSNCKFPIHKHQQNPRSLRRLLSK